MARRRGPCPEPDALSLYHSGRLDPSEASSIRAHVAGCGVCEAALLALSRFDKPRPRWWRWIWHPIPGYAAAVLVLVFAVYRTAPPEPLPSTITWAPVTFNDLSVSRGATALILAKSQGAAILTWYADVSTGKTYEVALDGEATRPIAARDFLGNFQMWVDLPKLPAGKHKVVLVEKEGTSVIRRLEFPFELK